MEDFDFSQLSPEDMDLLMELGIVPEQQAMLAEQMAQAEALAKPQHRGHTTPGGIALGGIADLLNSGNSRLKQQKLREEQMGLLGKQKAGRGVYGGLLGGKRAQAPDPSNPYGGTYAQPGAQLGPLQEEEDFPFGRYGYVPGAY
jgi:hypothetical protein